ncbi:hypothetical protein PLICRDRAFT_102889 [Plicaturopsis crispa FD-325 SS-3]|nr:hypothetical protein PLICRDRAFT_102889 [Plicaturopsis crispa FD-325 SS-3]
MALTTATTTYTLLKYSRSYPTAVELPPKKADSEWQHFTNPVIQLFLNVTKLPTGALASVRLRIQWLWNHGGDAMDIDQRETLFEDIDLLSFSDLSSQSQSQGLPLKAVYRDCVVGIRYLHPRVIPAGAAPVYRRFQITFSSADIAAQFIHGISDVCPCKVNPTPAPTRAMNTAPVTQNRPQQNIGASIQTQPSSRMDMDTSSQPFSSSPALAPSMANQPPGNHLRHRASSSALPSYDPFTASRRRESTVAVAPGVVSNSSLPESSPPSSSVNSNANMMPPPLPLSTSDAAVSIVPPASPQDPTTDPTKALFLASLRENTSLYDLSSADLEALVSNVIREEGFVDLLQKLDSMWKVRAFLRR